MFTEAQRELLFTLVDASRRQKDEFIVIAFDGGQFIRHPGLDGRNLDVYYPDLTALRDNGCLTVTQQNSGRGFVFDISAQGFAAHEQLHAEADGGHEVEAAMHRLMDSEAFGRRYPKAQARWSKAADVLWSAEAEGHLSEVGHYAREAMQEFAVELLAEHQLTPEDPDKQHTAARVRQLLDAKKRVLGEKVHAWLDALLTYWGTVADLTQRQEHAAQREGVPLQVEDARRLVFQTMALMYEMSESLQPYRETAVRQQVTEDLAWLREHSAPQDFIPEEVSRERRKRETRLATNSDWLKSVGLEVN